MSDVLHKLTMIGGAVVACWLLVVVVIALLYWLFIRRHPEFENPQRPWSPFHPAYEFCPHAKVFKPVPLQDAPAVFLGWQFADRPDDAIELWNLLEDIPGHPRHSTVSRRTLELAGYWVPIAPTPAPEGKA